MARDTTSGHDGINRRGFLAGGAAVAFATVASRAPDAAAAGQPTGLLTSLLDDPLGVPASGLRLSWIVPAIGVAPMQSGYQIQLAASPASFTGPAGFASSGTLIWDSGKVNDTSSTAISYQGPALS